MLLIRELRKLLEVIRKIITMGGTGRLLAIFFKLAIEP